jgi:hypothetical protein
MSSKKQRQELGKILAEALDAVAEFGSPDRHSSAQVLGRETYDSLMSKQKTADLIDRWLSASPRTKPAATRALALGIARHVDDADLAPTSRARNNRRVCQCRRRGRTPTNPRRDHAAQRSTKPAPQRAEDCL